MVDRSRAADLRFLLPCRPSSVALLGAAAEGALDWAAAGVPVRDPQGPSALVVAPADRLPAALRHAPAMLLLNGRAPARRLAAAGYRTARMLALPTPWAPRMLVPLGSRAAVTAALAPVGRRGRTVPAAARAAAVTLLRHGVAPPRMTVTVACRAEPRPWLLDTAGADPAPATPWFLALGAGDPLQRAVLHVPGPGGGRVLKFSRIAGNAAPFEREQRAAAVVRKLPREAARHAPTLVDTGSTDGLPYLVESRFPGRSLTEFLVSRAPLQRRVDHVQRVAEWLHVVASGTLAGTRALDAERERLTRDVLPGWPSGTADLVAATAAVPAVLVHNDVGTWNVVTDGRGGFGVIDWESAAEHGLPLWDLTYFLADALTLLDAGRFADRT